MEGFSKTINESSVRMIITEDSKQKITYWSIYLYKSTGDSLLIDKFEFSDVYTGEPNMLKGDIRLKNIIGDVYVYDNDVYVVLYNFGNIVFNVYNLSDNSVVDKTTYFIGEVMVGSYMNFGEPEFYAKIKPFNQGKILIYTNENDLLFFDKFKGKVNKIILNEKARIKDNEKYFTDFDIQKNSDDVSNIIQNFISNMKNDIPQKIEYKGFIDDIDTIKDLKNSGIRDNGLTYFFYTKMNDLCILKYDNFENEWIVIDYMEEEIKQTVTVD